MSKKTLEMFENEFSNIYINEREILFHRNELPTKMINEQKKYTVLGLLFINDHFLLVQKKNGLYALPGGGTENKEKSSHMLNLAFKNAGCSDELCEKLVELTLNNELDYLALQTVREYLEETPVLMLNPVYFGHQKTKNWRDEIVYISNVAYHFDKSGQPEEIKDLSVLSKKVFNPIGKSVTKTNPCVIFSIKEMIEHIDKVVYTQQIVIARFLLTLKEKSIDVCFAETRLKKIAGIGM